jgi:O-antigen/teichoic acid export membrane protein
MAAISYINTGAKVLSFVIVWKFVVQPVDAAYVGVAMSIGWLVAGLLGIFVAKYTFKIKFLKPTLNGVWGQLCDGRDVFVSRFFGAMYRDANVIILSLWAGPVIVASYSISEKVVKSVQALQEVVGNVLFPYFSKINLSINARQSSAYRKLLIVSLLMYMLVAGSLSFFANAVVLYFDRNGNELAVEMLTLMSVVIVIGGLNYVVGILGFVASGQTKIFSRSVVIAGVSSLVISFVGCSLWGWHGAVLAFVVSEVVLLISMILMAFYQGRGSVI